MQTLTEIQPQSQIYVQHQALSPEFCQQLIEGFENTPQEQYPGRVGQTVNEDFSVKQSTDMVISGKAHWKYADQELFKSLAMALNQLKQIHPFFQGRFKDFGYALQRTIPGEFFHWHVDSGSHSFSDRQLVAIWYLNDVPGPGGETEFRHQNLVVQPEVGKLILFPPFWTHEHRGVTLLQGVKYIATTWVLFA